ncbi:MAG: hypothetical protein ACYDH1_13550 [Anaerolineaceae bacterium]|nr:MAG: hypothetical protein CVU46_01440 [Chloroflexi bacterium HGW-Chloroflexi-8]
MFTRLLTKDTHQQEYLNFKNAGDEFAFGLYIRASMQNSKPYCVEAKHRLYLCLDHISQFLDKEKLVAIYFDIKCDQNNQFTAFDQMVRDIKAGMFSKMMCFDLAELFEEPYLTKKIDDLRNLVIDLEVSDLCGNIIQSKSIPLDQLLGV